MFMHITVVHIVTTKLLTENKSSNSTTRSVFQIYRETWAYYGQND